MSKIKNNSIVNINIPIYHLQINSKCRQTKIVSEWLLFNANSAIFQLYHGENKLMMRSTLY
jgi:hypothetical protein